MEIKQIDSETKGVFIAEENGIEVGRMTYAWNSNDNFTIDHTEVNPDFKGKNIGKQMVMAAVDFARDSKVKIIPLCPFARNVFDKTSEIKDVLL